MCEATSGRLSPPPASCARPPAADCLPRATTAPESSVGSSPSGPRPTGPKPPQSHWSGSPGAQPPHPTPLRRRHAAQRWTSDGACVCGVPSSLSFFLLSGLRADCALGEPLGACCSESPCGWSRVGFDVRCRNAPLPDSPPSTPTPTGRAPTAPAMEPPARRDEATLCQPLKELQANDPPRADDASMAARSGGPATTLYRDYSVKWSKILGSACDSRLFGESGGGCGSG
jgi:hypothetical protein